MTKAQPRTYTKRDVYKPEPWTNEIARPGGEDNRKRGSLQADGSVKPYRAPIYGCVGNLKEKTGLARD